MYTAKEILKRLIEIDTSSPEGNESKAVQYLHELLKEFAVKVDIIGTFPRENIIMYFGDLDSKNILLLTGHLDVAPSKKEEWKTEPYIAFESDDKLYGRGACDMKGGIAICVEAIINAVRNNCLEDKLIIFAGTVDEEAGASSEIGAKCVAEYFVKNNIKPFGAILPEPNNDYNIIKVNIGHRGAMWLECESQGKAMHPGSTKHKEDNAIINMYAFIEALRKEIPGDPVMENNIPGSTCRVTYINAGLSNAFKFIPDKCVCNLDVRVSPLESNEEVLKKINSLAAKFNISVKCLKQAKSSIISENEKIVQLTLDELKEMRKEYEICCASPVCDAHWFNEVNIPTLNVLGASGGNVHIKDEYATLDSLEDRVAILENIIKRI